MSFKNKYCLLICCIVFITCLPCFAEDTPYEMNNSREEAHFIGTIRSLQAKFETIDDQDWYKIIVTHPGMLKFVFTPQISHNCNSQLIQYVSLLSKENDNIANIRSESKQDSIVELAVTIETPGTYYIKVYFTLRECCGCKWYNWGNSFYLKQDSYYTLKILPMAGLVLANVECSEADVVSCQSDIDCITYGGYWYDNRCNIEPCNAQYLSICPDETSCSNAGGYWSSLKAFCFNGDIADLEAGCSTNTTTLTQRCANFDFFTNSVHIPCFIAGNASYWLDLKLINDNPVQLELSNFGANE